MGWKSTIDIKRSEAVGLIIRRVVDADNKELENTLEALGYGDNTDLPYYGHNFWVEDDE